jgi:hypothetical protein
MPKKLVNVAIISLILSSYAVAEEHLSNQLQNLCNMNREHQLLIADSVMEQIAHFGLTDDHSIKHNIDPNLYKAGTTLLRLTRRIYSDSLRTDSCQREIARIISYLNNAKFENDKINEDEVLTSK